MLYSHRKYQYTSSLPLLSLLLLLLQQQQLLPFQSQSRSQVPNGFVVGASFSSSTPSSKTTFGYHRPNHRSDLLHNDDSSLQGHDLDHYNPFDDDDGAIDDSAATDDSDEYYRQLEKELLNFDELSNNEDYDNDDYTTFSSTPTSSSSAVAAAAKDYSSVGVSSSSSSSSAFSADNENIMSHNAAAAVAESSKTTMAGHHAGSTSDYLSPCSTGSSSASSLDSSSKQLLYAAYNELHTLAQSFEKDFDAPAVVVVGHQSSGKSALIEALMGFQFNQVGGGTKTRRPIALQMKYNPEYAIEPKCYLELPNGKEEERTLAQIQDYIEQENQRLEKDPIRSFDRREIKIRMEYKHCPNLILIDTPGLIAAPKIVGRGARAGREVAQQRALHKSAQDAERLVVEKISCPDYLIVCVEDTADWKHGPTREVVQKADPDLSRTIVVNTKLDTKLPQFGSAKDTVEFLQASILDRTSPQRLGGPFYTSIPSGRVQDDGLFDENEEFVLACQDAQLKDWATIRNAIKRSNSGSGTNKNSHHNTKIKIGESLDLMQSRVGLTQLRTYLEEKVDETYRANVNKILPMLREEQKTAERKLERIEKELDSISLERLKAGAETFCDDFCQALRKSLQGSIVAPSNVFGETLSQEASTSGVDFHNVPNSPMAVSDRTWERLVRDEVGHSQHRLYGGSQYHRCLREFNLATKCLRLPTITEDEIANAAGVGDTHDGVNFLHAACTIALQKARDSFEPMLEAFRVRVMHVMERLCPVAEYVIQNNQEWHHRTTKFFDHVDTNGDGRLSKNDVASNPQFRQLVRKVFEKFVRKCSDSALVKCQDDLTAITRYVTWNMDQGASGSLQRSLPDQMDLVHVYKVALKASGKDDSSASSSGVGAGGSASSSATSGVSNGSGSDASAPHLQLSSERTLRPISDSQDERDYSNLLQLMEEAICSRNTKRTNMVVGSLVQHIVTGWRESFGRTVTMKFNCYFMLPFINDFHKFMRDELQAFYDNPDGEATDVFDLQLARRALQMRRSELVNELHANTRLQAKFVKLSDVMNKRHSQQQSSMKLDSFDF